MRDSSPKFLHCTLPTEDTLVGADHEAEVFAFAVDMERVEHHEREAARGFCQAVDLSTVTKSYES